MKDRNKILRGAVGRKLAVVCLCALFVCSCFAMAYSASAKSTQRFVTIDFNDVDINLFIKYISELTGQNFIVDRSVKGNVTIISPTQISEQEAYKVFESVLEVNGYTAVPSGSVTKIVPAVNARSKSIATLMSSNYTDPSDRVITQIIPLVHTNADDLKKILAPLVSKTSVLISHAASGMLIITDVQSNINRLMEIIDAVDVPSIGEEVKILQLEHADVQSVAKSMNELFAKQAATKGVRGNQIVKVIAYERTNSLIVFAPRAQIDKIEEVLRELDTEVPRGEGNIRVYYLQHANAEELVKVLTNLPEKGTTTNKQGAVKAPAISSDVKMVADAETNSIIITAPREEYLVLEDVIKKLDIPRRMVYMEALIMEVQVDKDFNIGVQWGGAGSYNDETGTLFSGFSGNQDNPYDVISGMTADKQVLPAGFALGVLQEGVEIGGVYFPNLGAVINAYKNDEDINIIATPQILTTDNKEASIKVGENVPYITSKNTTASEQDYTNYEYKDVATSLKITPQINQADVVRLEIGVEVIKLKDLNDGNPTTFTRTADTTVIVHNEETVVLGGMIGQDTSSGEYKVPLLGDIPLLGWLFKSRTSSETKTNLFIFITPHIVENPAELAAIYYKKRDIMENLQPGSSDIPDQFFYDKPSTDHAAALTDLGFARLQKKQNGAAKDYFMQALRIDPQNPYATINLGVVYEREGRYPQAKEMYERVLELQPQPAKEGSSPAYPYEDLRQLAKENLMHLGQLQEPKP
ncbi:type II secretion system secretin GspD [Desulfogranum japonicum]|uniref:type II secretion system secretin GspD n=1 Tax=Desulfogranum japonicum TaxID=231447 RepID=UPI00040A7D0B|nr:type II secretion system secretin GspD [Desulfogranum japonicum]